MIHNFACRGIGEQVGQGMIPGIPQLRGLHEYLEDAMGDRVRLDEVPWAAKYGPVGGDLFAKDYGDNLDDGMEMIFQKLDALPEGDMAFLTGFSAGATLAGNYALAAAISPRAMRAEKIRAVGLIADPLRPRGAGMPAYTAPDFGIGGQRRIDTDRFPVFWAADPMDPITTLPENSPLRTIADQTWAMSLRPGEFPQWMHDLVDRLKTNRWQKVAINWLDPIATWRQYGAALDAANRYLRGGDHLSYGQRWVPGKNYTYLQALADCLSNWE